MSGETVPDVEEHTHYDSVIVGAGSAGCVLAARTVLLLEAGRDYRDILSVPAALATAAFDPSAHPDYIWSYDGIGTPQQEHRLPVVRGKVIGGSGAINGANFIRNVPEDFDTWNSDLWSFPAVLPFFRKLESDRDCADDVHGTEGPIPVGRCQRTSWSPFHAAFYDGAVGHGFPEKSDLSSPHGSGVGPLPLNNITGIRMNSALAYLNPARTRANLTVRAGARVLRLGVTGRRADRVEALIDGRMVTVGAGEIILCAGGIESPHLLMLSGIGPADELRRLGIDVVADVPGVGRNLSDHGTVQLAYAPTDPSKRAPVPPQTVGLICTVYSRASASKPSPPQRESRNRRSGFRSPAYSTGRPVPAG
jgi:choline dehydrogenase-like flavoprotein